VLHAQSYSPKEIRFEGANMYASADLLATAGLKSGGTVSVKDIEAAMQRLADTGLFSDTRYAVNSQALTLTLTPIDAKQVVAIRYANFMWWRPEELTPLVHARVPLFQGKVPLNGNLIDSVKQALVSLLAEKGIAAKVDSMSSTVGGAAIAITISDPQIKVGEVRLNGASPAESAELAKIRGVLSGDDFDEFATLRALVNETKQVYQDEGYLDIAVDSVAHAAPRADGASHFLVDLSATIHGDELFHVASAEIHGAAPVSTGDLQKLLQIKGGDPAAVYDLRSAELRLSHAYRRYGYLDADAHVDTAKDPVAHKVSYEITMVSGEQYHVAAVQPSGFRPDQQAEFEKSFHPAPNAVYDEAFMTQIVALQQRHAFGGVRIAPRIVADRKQHTVVITLTTAASPAH
jgi:outer membrane protein assembly factor BamA